MRSLNLKWRGIDRPTDVLSFPSASPGSRAIGDIVICPSYAQKRAKEYGAPFKEEIRRLLIHGIVHLLGYDHEEGGAQGARMKRKENALLRRMLSRP